MMYMILSEMNDTLLPTDPAERGKLMMPIMEMVKKDLESGILLMYGVSPGGNRGLLVTKSDPKEIYAKCSVAIPYVKFEVVPLLEIDEVFEVMKQM